MEIKEVEALPISEVIRNLENIKRDNGDVAVCIVATTSGGPEEHMYFNGVTNVVFCESSDKKGQPFATIVATLRNPIYSPGLVDKPKWSSGQIVEE